MQEDNYFVDILMKQSQPTLYQDTRVIVQQNNDTTFMYTVINWSNSFTFTSQQFIAQTINQMIDSNQCGTIILLKFTEQSFKKYVEQMITKYQQINVFDRQLHILIENITINKQYIIDIVQQFSCELIQQQEPSDVQIVCDDNNKVVVNIANFDLLDPYAQIYYEDIPIFEKIIQKIKQPKKRVEKEPTCAQPLKKKAKTDIELNIQQLDLALELQTVYLPMKYKEDKILGILCQIQNITSNEQIQDKIAFIQLEKLIKTMPVQDPNKVKNRKIIHDYLIENKNYQIIDRLQIQVGVDLIEFKSVVVGLFSRLLLSNKQITQLNSYNFDECISSSQQQQQNSVHDQCCSESFYSDPIINRRSLIQKLIKSEKQQISELFYAVSKKNFNDIFVYITNDIKPGALMEILLKPHPRIQAQQIMVTYTTLCDVLETEQKANKFLHAASLKIIARFQFCYKKQQKEVKRVIKGLYFKQYLNDETAKQLQQLQQQE
ncbi:Hypothetical_protein [Hexamita inflata]|uniref:Hypothetical_protein n=1 Tax=Hexamita inflata TaxID=28002 RepID=A0AA86U0M8_9EUKA|nr:Hypothetical protein HINF_LOCUS14643 [Hexamita inflata]